MGILDGYKAYEIRSSFLHSKHYPLRKSHKLFTQLLEDGNLNLIVHISIFSSEPFMLTSSVLKVVVFQ